MYSGKLDTFDRNVDMKSQSHGVRTLQRIDTSPASPADLQAASALHLVEPGAGAVYVVNRQDIPPDGGYGWICTVALFLINAHTWGVNSAWAVFLSHYLADRTFPGATQFQYALIGGLSISQSLIISPVVAWSMRRLGTRPSLAIGTLLVFTSLFSASFATRVWHLFLTQGAGFGFGMGFLYIPATAVLPQWFLKRRSLATGIASSGAGFGGVAYNLIAGVLIRKFGVEWTYRIIALCTLVVNGVCGALMKDRNNVVKPKQDTLDWHEFGHIEVIFIILWGFLSELGYIVLWYSLPHYGVTIGLSQSQGSVVAALLNLGLGVSRPLVGYLSDRFGRINMAAFMTAYCGVLCFALWVPARSYAMLLVFALFVGLGCGTFWGTITAVTAEVVGLRRLPTAFGIICIALVAPTTFAEPIGLQIVSASGYLTSQIFIGFIYLLAASSLWFLRSWKITEIEEKAQIGSVDVYGELDRFHAGSRWLSPRKLVLVTRV